MEGKVLVANRGEIAIRIMRACRELGINTVSVYSEADKEALFAKYADEAYFIGPAPVAESYLNIKKIVEVARACNADAVHPGYGLLSENPSFAYACEREGIKFIGPSSGVLRLAGDKVSARREMQKVDIPVVPGMDSCVTGFEQAREVARELGYPVMVKPSGGGGGIGIAIVRDEEELKTQLDLSQKVAASTFGLRDVYIEKYIERPRHIEFQILADSYGNVIHLGERECSIQRRYQKLIEESPSTALTPELRHKMGQAAVRAARSMGYEGAGTVEFIFSKGNFYFLEVNARIQVEHPVTEMVTGIDIVKEGICIAFGMPLNIKQEEVQSRGWAIECRINAENPLENFAPSPGKISGYRSPGGIGVRVDSGVHTRYTIPPLYDPLISKLIVWGRDRDEAIARMRRALYEYIIVGVKTNILFHKAVMENSQFLKGELGTHFITEQTTLLDDMKRIMEREKTLEEKLSSIFEERKKVAALAAVSAVTRLYHRVQD